MIRDFYSKMLPKKLLACFVGLCVFTASTGITSLLTANAASNDTLLSDCYYSSDLQSADPEPASFEDYFETGDDGSITRINSSSPGGEYKDMAIYYPDENIYRDFVFEVDYYNPTGDSAFIGFAGVPGYGWDDIESGTIFWETGGNLRIRGTLNNAGALLDGWGHSQVPECKDGEWHHAVLKVEGNKLTFTIDGVQTFWNDQFSSWYDGGYLFLATNREGVSFKNIKISSNTDDTGEESNTYYSSDLQAANPESAAFEDYFETGEDGAITRINSSSPGGEYKDMAIYYPDNITYRDFTFDVDYYNPTGDSAFVGFAGVPGYGWDDIESGTIFWETGGNLRIRGTLNNAGALLDGWGHSQVPDCKDGVWHHMTVRVENGVVTVFVDGVQTFRNDQISSWYEGGRVFLATNREGVSFKNIEITSLSVDTETGGDLYYSSDLQAANPEPAAFEDYFETGDDGSITRINSSSPGGEYKDMAIYYPDEADYRSFILEVDYYNPAGSDAAFVGFAGVPGYGWDDIESGTIFWETGGNLRIRGTLNNAGALLDGWGSANVPDCNDGEWHNMVLKVEDKTLTVTIDGVQTFWNDQFSSWYDGGRVFLASNREGVSFKNIKITSLSESIELEGDTYYSSDLTSTNPSPADFGDYFRADADGTITRINSSSPGDEYKDMAIYYPDDIIHRDFIFEVDYYNPSGDSAFVGFAGIPGYGWDDIASGTIFWETGGSLRIRGTLNNAGALLDGWGQSKVPDCKDGEWHHMVLKVEDKSLTVTIDGVRTFWNDQFSSWYDGGRVFLATNREGVSFKNIKITTILDYTEDFTGYDEWYSEESLKTSSLTDVDGVEHWQAFVTGDGETGVIRRPVNEQTNQAAEYQKMSYLYLVDREYENFRIELDYKHGTSGWMRSYLGFGADLGKHHMEADGGIVAFSQPEGFVHYDGNVSENGKFKEEVFWSVYDDDGNDLTCIRPYDKSDWHHLVLSVQDGWVTMQIDEFPYLYEISLPATYDGGYIYLASNSSNSTFKNITVTDLTIVIDPETQIGWIPEEGETEFDFSDRKLEIDIAKWTYKKITEVFFN